MNEETKLFTPNAANLCLVGCRPADGTIVINGLGGSEGERFCGAVGNNPKYMNTQTRFPRTRASVEAGVIATLPVVSPATRPLTAGERKELLECETKIYSGLDQIGKCWREIAQRWRHILDEKLYREDFRTI
jgi:hypothetical protein